MFGGGSPCSAVLAVEPSYGGGPRDAHSDTFRERAAPREPCRGVGGASAVDEWRGKRGGLVVGEAMRWTESRQRDTGGVVGVARRQTSSGGSAAAV